MARASHRKKHEREDFRAAVQKLDGLLVADRIEYLRGLWLVMGITDRTVLITPVGGPPAARAMLDFKALQFVRKVARTNDQLSSDYAELVEKRTLRDAGYSSAHDVARPRPREAERSV